MITQCTHDIQFKIASPFNSVLDTIISAPIATAVQQKPIRARPFVKWVGGKGAIASLITEYLPQAIPRYYELFTGGGAVFFHNHDRIESATLVDSNHELITAYEIIRNDLQKLISRLTQYQDEHSKDHYYATREKHDLTDPIEIAARFIYLNKTCYNGLYRVNRQGRFNSPMGSYVNPAICDEQNLTACHAVLQNIEIISCSFDAIDIADNSLVYCDPPYDCNYNQYQAAQFSGAMQERIMRLAKDWHKRGCKVIISNSDTELIRNLYTRKPFRIHEITAPRSVSCKSNGRGSTTELLIITE